MNPFSKLALLFQCAHSVLTLLAPRPSVTALSGAGIFLKTKPFLAYLKTDAEINSLLTENRQLDELHDSASIWELCHTLVLNMDHLPIPNRDPIVDDAFNLLYLATGIFYHDIVALLPAKPNQNPNYATVEDLGYLTKRCQWTVPTVPGSYGDLWNALIKTNAAILHSIARNAEEKTG